MNLTLSSKPAVLVTAGEPALNTRIKRMLQGDRQWYQGVDSGTPAPSLVIAIKYPV